MGGLNGMHSYQASELWNRSVAEVLLTFPRITFICKQREKRCTLTIFTYVILGKLQIHLLELYLLCTTLALLLQYSSPALSTICSVVAQACLQAPLSSSLVPVCRQLPLVEERFSEAALFSDLEFRSAAFLHHAM